MIIKTCVKCNCDKPIDQFGKVGMCCKDCINIEKAEWYKKNRKTVIEKRLNYAKQNRIDCNRRNREYHERLRTECYNILGNICSCGETDKDVFQIDHINGGGNIEHQKLARHQFLLNVKSNPDKYQILCANCNWGKRESWLQRSKLVTELQNKAIEKYGGCCVECGINDFEILQFDHINNDGANNYRCRDMKTRYNSYIKKDHSIQLLCCNDHQRKSLRLLKVLS